MILLDEGDDVHSVVGILLDRKTYLGILRQKTGYERIDLYNKAAENLGITPFYMCLQHISEKSALGLCYENKKYRLIRLPIPKVTHNRAMTLTSYLQKQLGLLSNSSIVFNGQNRHDKLRIHKLLSTNKSVRDYLPESMAYSSEQLIDAMERLSSLYIKPTNSSIGKGVIKVTKKENEEWQLCWSNIEPKMLSDKKAQAFIHEKVGTQSYLIQQAISLATYQGRPYDLRVSAQRGDKGKWQITGIAGKVAASGRHVTNLAKGGEARRCEELFRASGFDPYRMKADVEQASLIIAESLSERIPAMADVGLDVGVDQSGRIKLIEVNGRDQRYEFKQLKMYQTFNNTYETPLRYAKFLLNR
jgi:glutathione synthase/RimK-type ligase-like ATP-grasp enzyme